MPLSLKNLDMIFSFTPPNQMLTSVLKRVDVAAADVSQRFLDGNHPHAQLVLGLKDHAVGLASVNHNIVTDEKVIKELSKIEENIISGRIKISQN